MRAAHKWVGALSFKGSRNVKHLRGVFCHPLQLDHQKTLSNLQIIIAHIYIYYYYLCMIYIEYLTKSKVPNSANWQAELDPFWLAQNLAQPQFLIGLVKKNKNKKKGESGKFTWLFNEYYKKKRVTTMTKT